MVKSHLPCRLTRQCFVAKFLIHMELIFLQALSWNPDFFFSPNVKSAAPNTSSQSIFSLIDLQCFTPSVFMLTTQMLHPTVSALTPVTATCLLTALHGCLRSVSSDRWICYEGPWFTACSVKLLLCLTSQHLSSPRYTDQCASNHLEASFFCFTSNPSANWQSHPKSTFLSCSPHFCQYHLLVRPLQRKLELHWHFRLLKIF